MSRRHEKLHAGERKPHRREPGEKLGPPLGRVVPQTTWQKIEEGIAWRNHKQKRG